MTRSSATIRALMSLPAADTGDCSELLAQLRHGVRKSRQLAEQLERDALVGPEARAFLARLQMIAAELDSIEQIKPELRSVEDDPIWGKFPRLRR